MYVSGIDPHRGSQAAAVLDGDERVQRQRLVEWASQYTPRRWAVEPWAPISEGLSGSFERRAVPVGEVGGEVVGRLEERQEQVVGI